MLIGSVLGSVTVLSIASIKSNVAENPLKSKSEHSNNREKEEQWCGCECVSGTVSVLWQYKTCILQSS
jgi:hypothetical protein